MPIRGIGSISSPIVISDDEDEAIVYRQLQLKSPKLPIFDGQRAFAAVAMREDESHNSVKEYVASRPDHQRNNERDSGRAEPVPITLKRKRDEDGVRLDNTSSGLLGSPLNGPSKPESKKARKRRRRLERMEAQWIMDREAAIEVELQKAIPNPLTPTLQSWPGAGSAFNPYNATHTQGSTRSIIHQPIDRRNIPSGPLLSSAPQMTSLPAQPRERTSSRYGGLPPRPASDVPPPKRPSLYPIVPMGPSGQSRFQHQLLSVPIQTQLSPPKARPRPAKKGVIIGAVHNGNPLSTHGLFYSTAIQSNGVPYAPNITRTLVMEQLPKAKRSRDAVMGWCKFVCGTFPVHVELNPEGRALIEFPSTEMANRAFLSPPDVLGMSSARVWWYRGSGDGAGVVTSKKAEIEEGEIEEGENTERESDESPLAPNAMNAKKWQRGMQNRGKQAVTRASSATRSVVSTSSGGAMSQSDSHSLTPLLSIDATARNARTSSPRLVTKVTEHISDHESGHDRHVYYPAYAAGTVGMQTVEPNHKSFIALSRQRPPKVEPVTSSNTETEYISEDMDVESPVTTRQSSGHPNGHQSLPTRRELRSSPAQYSHTSSTLTVSSLVPTLMQRLHPAPSPVTKLNTIPHKSSSPVGESLVPAGSTPPSAIPSGLRAMKNTPTGPSFAKRSLLARHKDLEERIAKTKIQLIQAADRAQSKTTLPQVDLNPANPSTATPVVPTSTNPDLKVAMEDNLRRLVMESKRNKGQSPSATLLSPPDPDSHSATIIAVGTSTTSSPTPAPSVNLVVPEKSLATFSQDALDDLAVSFITEAIQNIKASPPLPPRTSHSAIKLVLAAKQQRLEKQIAESKVLMAQLTSARTKQEKDRILAAMRERSRMTEEDIMPTSPVPPEEKFSDSSQMKDRAHCGLRWPETREDAGVLMISDDEDEV